MLDGGAHADTFILSGGGDDTAYGGGIGNDDTFQFGAAFTANDKVDGGGGIDTVFLAGDYSALVQMKAATMVNVEAIVAAAGFDYSLKTNDATVASNKTLTVDASALGAGDSFNFDGSKETNGSFVVNGGTGADTLRAGNGSDLLSGGADADTYVYGSSGDSRGQARDTILGFDALKDRFDGGRPSAASMSTVSTGALSEGSFKADLKAAVGVPELAANHAVLFTPDTGGPRGRDVPVRRSRRPFRLQPGARPRDPARRRNEPRRPRRRGLHLGSA